MKALGLWVMAGRIIHATVIGTERHGRWLCTALAVCSMACAMLGAEPSDPGSPTADRQASDFAREILPILQERCWGCHGTEKQESGLRLDYRGGLLAGGDHGPAIVPGHSSQSRLILRVSGSDPDGPRMPFKRESLSTPQIASLRAWIDQGAVWPDSPQTPPRRTSSHWAFSPVKKQSLPPVRRPQWVSNAIDRFILARLESEGIFPSPQADRYTLIRRVYLDLLGLPPSPEQADGFVADASPDAYERMVDRALDSPAYGERWGRHWLDQARYADSHGYSIDSERTMWPYRDWVIRAINLDMPFDRFTVEQMAGDLLADCPSVVSLSNPSDPLAEPAVPPLIATAFHRNTLVNQEGGVDPEQFRVESIVDRVNTTGSVWLGLTLGCAQCHSHKFDPISQREYYQFYAFFNSTEDRNSIEPMLSMPTPQQQASLGVIKKQVAEAQARLKALAKDDPARPAMEMELKKLASNQASLERKILTVMVMRELKELRPTHIQVRGDFLRKGEQVQPDVPQVMPPLKSRGPNPDRLDLARWLVDPANPLTPRVTVNRIWMRFFGRGLVETENDFGTQGTAPTHPQLLDWLAGDFVRGGWSVKRLHRLIVTSATYRQSSRARPDLRQIDPLNRLLAHQERLRVEAEVVRDAALAACGMLTHRIGGPSVHPPQPENIYAFTQTAKNWPTDTTANRFRRTMYTFFYRSAPHPLLTTFDSPDFQATCTRRLRSDTPLQALTAANDAGLFELAGRMAGRVLRETPADERVRCERLFRLCLTRPPAPQEVELLLVYARLQERRFQEEPSSAEQVAFKDRPQGVSPAQAAAWVAVGRAMMNLDEFITRE